MTPKLRRQSIALDPKLRRQIIALDPDPDVMRRWIAALRSGEYKQGKGQLRGGGRYCCWGVLSDVVEPGGWNERSHLGASCFPSIKVQDAVFPKRHPGDVDNAILALVSGNDRLGWTFPQIADFLETCIPSRIGEL